MFKKLREKLKNWTKKVSKEKTEEEIVKEPEDVKLEKKEDSKVEEKVELPKPEKYPEPPFKEKIPIKKKEALISEEKPTEEKKLEELTNEEIDKKLEDEVKKADEIKETKFEVGTQKVEPDLEKIKEVEKKISEAQKEIKKIEKTKELAEKVEELEKKEIIETKKRSIFSKILKPSLTIITQKDFDVYSEDLEMLLIENNVALEVAQRVISRLKEEIVGKEFLKKEIEDQIETSLKDILIDILIEPFSIIEKIKEKSEGPYVILFCGINGTGKTTTIAKIAKQLKDSGLSCVMAAADTFRAASIEQIKKHADKLNIKLISHDYGSDPAAVGFDAVKYAKKNRIDVVLIDTAGRMHSEKNLLKELEKINRVNKPDLKIFVGEAITGNDSIEQVRSFNYAIGIDGIILTKADTDEKGGTALSVGYVTKKPILYLGTGQEYKDLTIFNKQKFIDELGL